MLFGATGDLAGRFLLPAVAALEAAGRLPPGFELVGAARQAWDERTFRDAAAERLAEHAAGVPAAAREAVVASSRYRPFDLSDRRSVADAIGAGEEPVAAYLALPPGLFPSAVTALAQAGLPRGSRIVVEKPFGEDLGGAIELNRRLAEAAGDAGEQAVFRVDHVLGMATVQNLLGMRLESSVLGSVWSSAAVDRVDILWEETLGLEGRAGYYDRAGALKDVVQNHLLQILCLVTLEPPRSADVDDLRDRKLDVLRSIRTPSAGDMAARTRRARYTAGTLAADPDGGSRAVPSYADEDGVDPDRSTETFAEILLDLDSDRWAGTAFRLRAGKALAGRRKGAILTFRPASERQASGDARPADALWIGLDGPTDIALRLIGGTGMSTLSPARLALSGRPPRSDLPPYGRVLLDVLSGGSALSVRADEAEESWRVVTPILDAWAGGGVPLEEYSAGSPGPPPLPI